MLLFYLLYQIGNVRLIFINAKYFQSFLIFIRVVSIQHVQSQLYIAMNSDGRLITTETFSTECKFKENVFENYWCIYSSIQYKHPETQVQLAKLAIFEKQHKSN